MEQNWLMRMDGRQILPSFPGTLLVVGLVLSGCAGAPDHRAVPHTPYSLVDAREVVAAGYASIAERYIDSVDVERMALEGMRGLGAIDPAITVKSEGDSLSVQSHDTEIARFAMPKIPETDAWADLTLKVSEAARPHSVDLQAAGAEKLYEAVFDGALSSLDIFSRYAGAADATKNRAKRDGFGGIGVNFKIRHNRTVVTEVMPDTPAFQADIRVGDILTHVGQVPLRGLTAADVARQLHGPVHTRVDIAVQRATIGHTLHFTLERAHIIPKTVHTRFKDGVLLATISSFNQNTSTSLAQILGYEVSTRGRGLKAVVLDLRGNPGGLLRQSIKVADLFLDRGVIVNTRGRHPESLQHYEAGGRDLIEGRPLAVLIDGKSASAAEIVAAALQDQDRAAVIGTTSYGKGTVQTVIRLPNAGEITLTWSRFVSPAGTVLHGLGVQPSYCTSGLDGYEMPGGDWLRTQLTRSAEDMVIWRETDFRDEKAREALRRRCPAERRKLGLELDLARAVLLDPALYARAVHPETATAEMPDGPKRR